MKRILFLIIVLITITNATTFICDFIVTDPISGSECQVCKIGSYGGYIYKWDSKYDLVFWPHTEESWIWVCPQNGYMAFGDDFEYLTDKEKENIKIYLKDNPVFVDELNHSDKLDILESIYKLREEDNKFWCWFYRLRAYIEEDSIKSLNYRKKALSILENKKESYKFLSTKKLWDYYIIADYNRQLGNIEKSEEYYKKATRLVVLPWKRNQKKYILQIIKERSKLLKKNP